MTVGGMGFIPERLFMMMMMMFRPLGEGWVKRKVKVLGGSQYTIASGWNRSNPPVFFRFGALYYLLQCGNVS